MNRSKCFQFKNDFVQLTKRLSPNDVTRFDVIWRFSENILDFRDSPPDRLRNENDKSPEFFSTFFFRFVSLSFYQCIQDSLSTRRWEVHLSTFIANLLPFYSSSLIHFTGEFRHPQAHKHTHIRKNTIFFFKSTSIELFRFTQRAVDRWDLGFVQILRRSLFIQIFLSIYFLRCSRQLYSIHDFEISPAQADTEHDNSNV